MGCSHSVGCLDAESICVPKYSSTGLLCAAVHYVWARDLAQNSAWFWRQAFCKIKREKYSAIKYQQIWYQIEEENLPQLTWKGADPNYKDFWGKNLKEIFKSTQLRDALELWASPWTQSRFGYPEHDGVDIFSLAQRNILRQCSEVGIPLYFWPQPVKNVCKHMHELNAATRSPAPW